MKYNLVSPTWVLLLLTLTVFVNGNEEKCKAQDSYWRDTNIKLSECSDGIKLECTNNDHNVTSERESRKEMVLRYMDNNTGEYVCKDAVDEEQGSKIFVKFRTCDNCIELDLTSMIGIVIGDVVATIVVGVSVYLVASQAGSGPIRPARKNKAVRD
ncbi:uncharacterized protein KZ484_022733 [Pholidichthys leucotaenia]